MPFGEPISLEFFVDQVGGGRLVGQVGGSRWRFGSVPDTKRSQEAATILITSEAKGRVGFFGAQHALSPVPRNTCILKKYISRLKIRWCLGKLQGKKSNDNCAIPDYICS